MTPSGEAAQLKWESLLEAISKIQRMAMDLRDMEDGNSDYGYALARAALNMVDAARETGNMRLTDDKGERMLLNTLVRNALEDADRQLDDALYP